MSAVTSLVDDKLKVSVGSLTESIGSDMDVIRSLSKHQIEVLITMLSGIKKYKYAYTVN